MSRWLTRWIFGRPRRRSRLRLAIGVALTAGIAMRPIQLSSTQWWRSPDLASSIELTERQRDTMEALYRSRLTGRQQCVERVIEAINHVDQLLRDRAELDEMLRATQSAAVAAADEQPFARTMTDEMMAILSERQRLMLVTVASDELID